MEGHHPNSRCHMGAWESITTLKGGQLSHGWLSLQFKEQSKVQKTIIQTRRDILLGGP